jgi:hypothetical protein
MEATVRLVGGVTVEAALATVEQVLGIVAGLTPTGIDNHVLEYVRALRKSPELVGLLERDIGGTQAQALNFSTIMLILQLVNMIRNGGDLASIIKAVMDLIGKVGAANPIPRAGYTPATNQRC